MPCLSFFPGILHNGRDFDRRYCQMSKKSLFVVAVLSVAAALPARADLAAGLKALEERDYAAARTELLPLGKQNPKAAFALATMYENGWGVPHSDSAAAAWYRRAADGNDAEAQFRYARHLFQGKGLPRDRKGALDWFTKAAKQNHAAAQREVGKILLFGAGKKPNFLAAKDWLNKAAQAGDAEAQAILDEFAARDFPILVVPGTTDPADEAARKVLGEIKGLIEPLLDAPADGTRIKLAQKPTVMAVGDGHVVTLPSVEIVGDMGRLRLGMIQIAFKPQGADYAVELKLPTHSRTYGPDGVQTGTFGLGSGKLTGTWSTTLHSLTDFDAVLTGVRIEGKGASAVATVEAATAARTFTPAGERTDVAETVEFRNVAIAASQAGQDVRVRLGGLAYAARYEGLDLATVAQLARQFGFDWRTGARLDPVTGEQRSGPVLRDVLLTASIKDVVAEDGHGAVLAAIAGGEVALGGAGLDQALASFSVTYAHRGLDSREPMLPRDARMMLSVNRLPLAEMAAGTVGVLRRGVDGAVAGRTPLASVTAAMPMEAVSDLGRIAVEAGTELRVDEIWLKADDFDLAVRGAFRPTAGGFAGDLDVRIAGLDALARTGMIDIALFNAVRALAVRENGPAGAPVEVFRLAFRDSGDITVNGQDAGRLFGKR